MSLTNRATLSDDGVGGVGGDHHGDGGGGDCGGGGECGGVGSDFGGGGVGVGGGDCGDDDAWWRV